jgi:alkylation response protein AidB-like acyl-CoA dehydrogenase
LDFRFAPDEEAFRLELRRFLKAELPVGWRVENDREGASDRGFAFSQEFARKLGQRGWLTMAWPQAFGGRGASPLAQLIYNEEMAYAGAPLGFAFGPNLVGPTLMIWGSNEQRQQHLPAIAASDTFWCQGFSEPGAGSDLAGLQTRAVRDGDDYVVDGQKIWTSEGHRADWMILLARTDPEAPKHRGISYFLVDLRSPGVSVRPLTNLMNTHAFNQVFFDGVRVPRSNLVGPENRGWYVATTTLDFERSGINRIMWTKHLWEETAAEVRTRSAGRERVSTAALAGSTEIYIELEVARLLCYRVAGIQARGEVPNYEASMAKLYGSEVISRFANWAVGLLGLPGQLEPASPWAALQGRIERCYLASVSYAIAGGTSEIQRNVIATRGIGLPRD